MGDGVRDAGGLADVADVLQADRPEHGLGRVADADSSGRQLAEVRVELLGGDAAQGRFDRVRADLPCAGQRRVLAPEVGAPDEDPVAHEVEAVDRGEPRSLRRVAEFGPRSVEDREPRTEFPRPRDLVLDLLEDRRHVAVHGSVGQQRQVDVADRRGEPPWARLPIA